MPRLLEGKIALVTGGTSGIGRASALAFAKEGAKVVVSGRNLERLRETVRLIEEVGGEAIFVRCDVSERAEIEAMVNKCIKTYGRMDCALNNAGIDGSLFTRIVDYSEEIWDQVIRVNLKGIWLCMKYEVSEMIKQEGGSIVNMSSTAGLVGSQVGNSAYVASKHGIVGLTKAVALEYAGQGIRVNAVCPAIIRTPMSERLLGGDPEREKQIAAIQPIGRIGTSDEVAAAVVWLCSDAASYITGHALPIDGGLVAK
jgi:NAD(P)-dependent dehydrogenase (short-subunit alcohol dehydrogenase family)